MKQKPSKLDAFADRLDEWFGVEHKTLHDVREQLRLDGCTVSLSRLSDWWSARQSARQQERLLGQITSGARACAEVEKQFAQNPAPGMEAISRLHRLLAFQLAAKGAADPEMIELSTKCTKMVLDYGKLQAKQAEQSLQEKRFQRDTCELFVKWSEDERAKAIAAGTSTNSEKIQALGKLMFGDDF